MAFVCLTAAALLSQLKVLRQLVELQLAHSAGIKSLIDRAWGVGHVKNKKKPSADVSPTPDPSDPFSRESLSYSPLGQDSSRKRYWVVDGMYTPSFLSSGVICVYLR